MTLTLEEGKEVVNLARSTLDSFVTEGKFQRRSWSAGYLSVKRGVFSTLSIRDVEGESLRGCIGFPYPIKPLGVAVQETTVAAASEDPRFPPVTRGELGRIVIEVSALTVPAEVKSSSSSLSSRKELPSLIQVGRDGLIVTAGYQSGLLLPQVAVEQKWEADEFLSQTCMKAGLLPDSWLDPKTTIQRFQAEIFGEEEPRGDVKQVQI